MESEINAFGTSCYRIMLNIKRIDRVSNAKIYDLTQTAPLVENVRTRQLRFLGHVLRMPDDEPCKEYALYIPPHGKRKPGRQRTLFLRYIQHLLGDTDNMIGPGKLSELAQDRRGWRKLVVACSAADWWWWWYLIGKGKKTLSENNYFGLNKVVDTKRASLGYKSILF